MRQNRNREYIGCTCAGDASAKVIRRWSNGMVQTIYYGDVDAAENCYIRSCESRMYRMGAWTSLDWKVKEGNSWV